MVDEQTAAGQRRAEGAFALPVFEDKVFAGNGGVDFISGRAKARRRHVADARGGGELGGRYPAVLPFLPHIEGCGLRTVVAVPCASAHDVPYARAAVSAARLAVVGVVEVGRTEVVPELVADNADVRNLLLALLLGLYRVALHGDAVDSETDDFAAVRPDVCRRASHFLPRALVDNGEAVEHAVAVVVELAQVYLVLNHTQGFGNHRHRALRTVVALRAVEFDPRRDGGFDVELAERLLEIVVAETARAGVILLVHHVLEIGLRVERFRVVVVDKQHEELMLTLGGERIAHLQFFGFLYAGLLHLWLRDVVRRAQALANACSLGGEAAAVVAQGRGFDAALCSGAGKSPKAFAVAQEGIAVGRFAPMVVLIAAQIDADGFARGLLHCN